MRIPRIPDPPSPLNKGEEDSERERERMKEREVSHCFFHFWENGGCYGTVVPCLCSTVQLKKSKHKQEVPVNNTEATDPSPQPPTPQHPTPNPKAPAPSTEPQTLNPQTLQPRTPVLLQCVQHLIKMTLLVV